MVHGQKAYDDAIAGRAESWAYPAAKNAIRQRQAVCLASQHYGIPTAGGDDPHMLSTTSPGNS